LIRSRPAVLPLLRHLPPGQLLRFGIVGAGATLTHLTVLSAGVELLRLSPVAANALAFCSALGVSYSGQSIWVFRVAGHGQTQVRRFLVSAVGGLLANAGLMALITGPLGWHYLAGFAAVTTLVPFGTFLANKFWVFARSGSR